MGVRYPLARVPQMAGSEVCKDGRGDGLQHCEDRPFEDRTRRDPDDRFAYKELQHLEAMGFYNKGEAKDLLKDGHFEKDGKLPVNISGGSLGVGNLLEATSLHRAYEAVLQLRKDAGERQVEAEKVLVQSWRGVPTATGAVAILGVV